MEHETFEESALLDTEELLARCMGNIEFAERLLAKFQGRLDEDIAELEAAVRAEDPDSIARVAHRIKGASANVAAHDLRRRAREIELLARERSLAELPAQLVELRSEQNRFAQCATLSGSPVAGESNTSYP